MGARLGQHFLFDPRILARIADAAGLTTQDTVLEIGPGKGTLTRCLAERAGRVVAIETDRRLAAGLSARFAGTNVEIVHGDALAVPWPPADAICGNIPYQITSPLIDKALTPAPRRPARIVFLMQREVADRLSAAPGSKSYGALSAGVQLVATAERLFNVSAGSFSPPPRVESAVVRITPFPIAYSLLPADELAARSLIRLAFQHRRAQLQRTLREGYALAPQTVTGLLRSLGIDGAARPETLAASQFLALARSLSRT